MFPTMQECLQEKRSLGLNCFSMNSLTLYPYFLLKKNTGTNNLDTEIKHHTVTLGEFLEIMHKIKKLF